ncbi:efflux RND transporter periplasmic adaptor subunit [Arsukibacterium perlucidum]|uniref:efflux RND transporter periplasmic adaptor subunit n=1 Tax=Arsukibacterium perlucidum TaxID=368811 RepID=UPI00037AA0F9|nr:efflux RND transporter periplasmic adaptor subunit [Arsukibacterium perlucidum]
MKTWKKGLLAAGVFGLAFLVFIAIQATAKPPLQKDQARSQAPLVVTQQLQAQSHRFELQLWAEVRPKEQTTLTPEVAGRIIALDPNFIAGGVITKGTVLVQLDDADYQVALLSAQAAVASAQSALAQEQAQARVAEQELKHLSRDQITALALRQPQLLSAEAALKSAQAGLQKAHRDLDRTRISAPYDALVVKRNIGLGQVVSTGTALGELYSVEQAELYVPVASFDLAYLPAERAGIPAQLRTEHVSRDAKVVRDLGLINSQTRMSHLVVQLDDPYAVRSQQPVIRFGQYVEVRLAGRVEDKLYTIPQDALSNGKVWLLQPDMTMAQQHVEVVRQTGKFAYVKAGLTDGQQLILTVPNFPQPGMAVRTEQSDDKLVKAE